MRPSPVTIPSTSAKTSQVPRSRVRHSLVVVPPRFETWAATHPPSGPRATAVNMPSPGNQVGVHIPARSGTYGPSVVVGA